MDRGRLIELVALTAYLVLAILGIVGKLLFDDWRARLFMLRPAAFIPPVRSPPASAEGI